MTRVLINFREREVGGGVFYLCALQDKIKAFSKLVVLGIDK